MKKKIHKYTPWIVAAVLIACLAVTIILYPRPTATTGTGTGGEGALEMTGNFKVDAQSF